MPQFPATTEAARAKFGADLLVGQYHRVVDRPVAASLNVAMGQIMVKDGATWRDSDAHRVNAGAWAAGTTYAVGDAVYEGTHWYQVTVGGESAAVTEPTWPTNGSTVVDNEVTWQDMGVPDDLSTLEEIGVSTMAFTTAAGETPTMPMIETGAVKRSLLVGLPTAYNFDGARLGNSLLTVDS